MPFIKTIFSILLFILIIPENELNAESPYPYNYPFPDGINSATYKERRRELRNSYSDKNLLIFFSQGLTSPKISQPKFRQDRNFFYLSGMPDPNSALIIFPGGIKIGGSVHSEILFITPQSRDNILWHGVRMGITDAKNILGIDIVLDFKRFGEVLSKAIIGIEDRKSVV